MAIHQFRRKSNNYGKSPSCENRTQDLLVPKPYPTPKMPLGYEPWAKILYFKSTF
ncbi:hypothetical protein Hanom_Chr16g01459811 [Helianthus anomalus]